MITCIDAAISDNRICYTIIRVSVLRQKKRVLKRVLYLELVSGWLVFRLIDI